MIHFLKFEYQSSFDAGNVKEPINKWWKQWKFENPTEFDVTQQENSYDCGVWVCCYVDCACRDHSNNFLPLDMPAFRQYIKYSLLGGTLLYR